jgi:ankyrin repeat protein
VYKLLLQHGSVPTAVDKNGSTPAHIDGMSGHFADEALLSKLLMSIARHTLLCQVKQRRVQQVV